MRPRRQLARAWFFGLVMAVLAPAAARAQRGVDAELFHPSLDGYGIFEVDRAEVARQWDFGVRLFANYAGNPLSATMSEPNDPAHVMARRNVLIDKQLALELGMHLGLTHWLELVVDVPVSVASYTAAYGKYGSYDDAMLTRSGFYAASPYGTTPPPNAAPLDARVGFKLKLLRKGMFGLAAGAIVTLPLGDDSAFLGDSGFTFQPKLIADLTRGAITAAINVGAIIRQETQVFDPYDLSDAAFAGAPRLLFDVGHELTWSAGLAYRIVRWVGLGAEMVGLLPLVGKKKDLTADVLGGLQLFPTRDVTVVVGAGGNVIASAARHDDYRVFVGVSWTPVDGRAPLGAGGIDSDRDGVPDVQDLCPLEPEDKDGFDDEDGCPELDNDGDGIPDARDKCPNEPEDRDGFADEDGCPELDNDSDGIPDAQDKCPNEPEDRDGFADDDGCPDLDNDGDGIADAQDKCPNEPETFNGVDDEDGCPDTGGAVVVAAGRISLPDQIQFDIGKATIAARSEALLNRVADKIKANPQIKRIRIEGHTDDVGTPQRNQILSQARAEAVRDYLMQKAIDGDRLQAVGYGNTRPLDPGHNSAARAKNRRVDFIIVEQGQ